MYIYGILINGKPVCRQMHDDTKLVLSNIQLCPFNCKTLIFQSGFNLLFCVGTLMNILSLPSCY